MWQLAALWWPKLSLASPFCSPRSSFSSLQSSFCSTPDSPGQGMLPATQKRSVPRPQSAQSPEPSTLLWALGLVGLRFVSFHEKRFGACKRLPARDFASISSAEWRHSPLSLRIRLLDIGHPSSVQGRCSLLVGPAVWLSVWAECLEAAGMPIPCQAFQAV